MLHLMIEAGNGHAYQADARLEDASGQVLARGMAVLAARTGFNPVPAGQYLLEDVKDFPASAETRREWGSRGLMFKPNNHRNSEAVLLHGGEMKYQGCLRAVYGSVRVDAQLLQALLQRLLRVDRPMLLLTVRIGEKPSAWRFWEQPSRDSLIERDDDGLDTFNAYWPEVARHRSPNSALSWASYFEDQEEQDEPGQASAPLFNVSPPSGVDSFGRVTDADPHPMPLASECQASDAAGPISVADSGVDFGGPSCTEVSTESTTRY